MERGAKFKTVADKVELRLGEGGYQAAQDPARAAPPTSIDSRRSVDRHCMRARSIEIISDGTLAGTVLKVDGVFVGGITRLEIVAQKGFPRVAAVATMRYDRMNIPEFGDQAGTEVRHGETPATLLVDIFER
jgi:hypothetical protein